MTKLDRRSFLIASAATAAAASLKSFGQTIASTPHEVKLTLHPDKPGPAIPANFVGLSFETQQLSDPTFFAPNNSGLIAQFKALAPHGVLRIGGNTSDVGWWKPTPDSTMPPLPANVVLRIPPGEKSPMDLAYAVTPQAVTNLRAFLDATGWTCLYGINLGTNTPALAAEQAVFAAKTLGPKLEYFQIGNEPDILSNRFRDKAKWTADAYFDEWLAAANAIRAAVPSARFGLPDTAGKPEWYAAVVDRLIALAPADRPDVAALSHHYYFTGPPSNPKANIPNLLQPNPQVDKLATDIHAAAAKLSEGEHRTVPYRMTEGNTCYRGGKPGFSDVFAASLWSADYLLLLASRGYAGVNLHGGDGQMVANSLGGTLPGDALVHDDPASHPHPYYTPIAHIGAAYVAEPVSYGMRFAQQFAGATLIDLDFDPGDVNATAYAARFKDGHTLIAIINKDAAEDLEIVIPGYRISQRLTAEGLTSTTVKFGPVAPTKTLTVPAASAAILTKAG
jgi:hypothetical protein